MQISSTAKNHQGTFSSLSTLTSRHASAGRHYQQLLSQLSEGEKLKEMIGSLANYHQKMETNLLKVINDLPDVPVKPNKGMESQYTSLGSISSDSATETAAHTCHAFEEEVLDIYKKLLDNDGIPENIHDALQTNSARVQDVISKLDRISKAGEQRDMNL